VPKHKTLSAADYLRCVESARRHNADVLARETAEASRTPPERTEQANTEILPSTPEQSLLSDSGASEQHAPDSNPSDPTQEPQS
jgi:hypothetical protein